MEKEQETKQLALYILMAKYLTIMGISREPITIEELSKTSNCFPDDWELLYPLDVKIKLLSQAIKEKQNLRKIVNSIKGDIVWKG